MGYYSDVAILLNKKAVDVMPDRIKEAFDKVLPNKKEMKTGEEEWTLFHVSCCKWNPMFSEDVSAIDGWLDKLDGDEDELYEFLRMGEDVDDEEHHSNHCHDQDRLTIERYIALDGETL